MMSAWYFGLCVKSAPGRASAYAMLLECLELGDGDLLRISCDSLCQADDWQQAYALPRVVQAVRRLGPEGGARQVVAARYLEELAGLLTPELVPHLEPVLDHLLDEDADGLKAALAPCAGALAARPTREPSRRPYLDLPQFVPELVVLTGLLQLAARPSAGGGDAGPFVPLLDRALQHGFGRLPFLLAVEIEVARGTRLKPDDLVRLIWTAQGCTAELEPDLLAAHAKVLATTLLKKHGDAPSAALALLDEAILLRELRDQLASLRRPAPVPSAAPLADLVANTDHVRRLAIALWQLEVWTRAARLDPPSVAQKLAAVWWTPPPDLEGSHVVEGPFGEARLRWAECAKLIVQRPEIQLEGKPRERLAISKEARWLVCSPWIELDTSRAPEAKDYHRYVRPLDAVQLLRLLGTALLAVRLLRRNPAVPYKDPPPSLPAILVHAADVLAMCRAHPDSSPRSEAVATLMEVATRRIRHAGLGHLDTPSPEQFMALFAATESDQTYDANYFRLEILPRVLLEWISDAYTTATEAGGASRWLPQLAPLHEHFRVAGAFTTRKARLLNLLLIRFFVKGAPLGRWLKEFGREQHAARMEKQVPYPRVLLLPQPRGADQWFHPEWRTPDLRGELGRAILLATERVASLEEPGAVPEAVQKEWWAIWADAMDAIGENKDCDRFLRLRLLELLDLDVVRRDHDAQERIAHVLLEFGTPYEHRELLRRLYPERREEWDQVPEARRAARASVLRAVLETLVAPLDESGRPVDRDPIDLSIDREQRAVAREAARRVAVLADPRDYRTARLLAILRAHAAREAEASGSERLVTGRVEVRDGRKGLVFDEPLPADWQVTCAVHDRNARRATVAVEPVEASSYVDLFSLSDQEREQILDGARGDAITVAGIAVEERPNGRWAVSCGLDEPKVVRATDELTFGAVVAVPLERQSSDDEWHPSGPATILRRRAREGEFRLATVHALPGKRGIEVQLDGADDRIQFRRDDTWDADGSRPFAEAHGESTVDEVPLRMQGGTWHPVHRGLEALLTSDPVRGSQHAFVLCFTGLAEQSGAFQFQGRPGEHYELKPQDFTAQAAERVAERCDSRERRGLLVTGVPTLDESGRVRLALAEDGAALPADFAARYPRLTVPFDDRNLQWQSLPEFTSGDPVAVHKDRDGWYLPLASPPPGYPERIAVTLQGNPPHGEQTAFARVASRKAPDEAQARVDAKIVRTELVKYPASNAGRFFDEWMRLKPGDPITLTSTFGELNDRGQLGGETDRKVQVWVDAESLSMRPIDGRVDFEDTRECRVEYVGDWKESSECFTAAPEGPPPPAVEEAGEGTGLLVGVSYGLGIVRILFETAEGACEWAMLVKGEKGEIPRRIRLGMQARVARAPDGHWQVRFRSRSVVVRGLWWIRDGGPDEAGLALLGQMGDGDEATWLAEGRAGELVHVPPPKGSRAHLAELCGTRYEGGFGAGKPQRTDNVAPPGRRGWTRAKLQFSGGALTGWCRADGPQQNVFIRKVHLEFRPAGDDGASVDVRRSFELALARTEPPPPRPPPPNPEETYRAVLRRYLDGKRPPLRARLADAGAGERGQVAITEPPEDDRGGPVRLERYLFPRNGGWSPNVDLAAGEQPLFDGEYEPTNCRVILRPCGDGVEASYSAVPPMDVAAFWSHLGGQDAPPKPGVRRPLKQPLFYIRREEPAGTSEGWHRFEFGCGYTLFAPESDLRFDGGPFRAAELALFFGDEVREVAFLEENGHVVLSIEKAALQFSEARTLYEQRKNHRIVHLLKVSRVAPEAKLEIKDVVGFDQDGLQADRTFNLRSVASDVEDPLGTADIQGAASILGRLDTKHFEKTGGTHVVFRRVGLTFDGEARLHPGELVFLQAGGVEPIPNDLALEVHPVPDLAVPPTPDADARRRPLLLFRRAFSAREDLLGRLQDKGLVKKELTGRLLLVRLAPERDHIKVGLRGIPPRRLTVLERDRFPLAVVARDPDARDPDAESTTLRLELRPGVFVHLEERDCDLAPSLAEGDVVRVEVRRGGGAVRYHVVRACAGDGSFVPAWPRSRPAVVLPTNRLMSEQTLDAGKYRADRFWDEIKNAGFSLGGLPGVVACVGARPHSNAPWRASGDDGIRLMEAPHPRVCAIGRSPDDGRYWISPNLSGAVAGALNVEAEAKQIALSPIGAQPATASLAMSWGDATFADQSIGDIANRIRSVRWTYHDTSTNQWIRHPEGSGAAPKDRRLHDLKDQDQGIPPVDGALGPLFAERAEGGVRLRYSQVALERFAFPGAELGRWLAARGSASVHVAGHSPRGGLWVELAPGRVAELPGPLVIAQRHGEERSLAQLHWGSFAVGDRLEVRLAPSHPLEVDRFALDDWHPGVRGAFRTAILPCGCPDPVEGALPVGAGAYTLTLPYGEREAPNAVELGEDGHFVAATQPRRGVCVLLVIDEHGRPAVAGFPAFRPRPDHDAHGFEGDPLAGFLRGDEEALKSAIRAAGGAIPVTVEGIAPPHGEQAVSSLFFSRADQLASCRLPAGTVTWARVLRALGTTIFLRVGGGIVTAEAQAVVSGLPPELADCAAVALRDAGAVIWVRVDELGGVTCAAGPATSAEEVLVEAVAVPRTSAQPGVICRDQQGGRLAWLPATEAGWAALGEEELRELFPAGRRFMAQLWLDEGAPCLSVTRVHRVRREFGQLQPGAQLAVKVDRAVSGPEGAPALLAHSESTGVILLMEVRRGTEAPLAADKVGKELRVEVIRRDEEPPRVAAVAVEERTFKLDLPERVRTELREPGALVKSFGAYFARGTTEIEADLDLRDLDAKSLPELDALVARLHWRHAGDVIPAAELAAYGDVCRAWKQRADGNDDVSAVAALMVTLLLDRVANGGIDRTAQDDEPNWNNEVIPNLQKAFQCHTHDAWKQRAGFIQDTADVARDIRARALRSGHVELLHWTWLLPADGAPQRLRTDGLWGRLATWAPVLATNVLTPQQLGALRQLCRTFELRESGTETLRVIAAALRAAIGDARGIEVLRRKANSVNELAASLRALPPRRRFSEDDRVRPLVSRSHLVAMKTVLEALLLSGWALPLLRPLPAFSRTAPAPLCQCE